MATSKFVGVSKHRKNWRARITINNHTVSLGTFSTPQEAALAYDNAARERNRKKLNFDGLKVSGTKVSLNEPIWVSSDGRRTPLSLLHANHLRNIERRLRYKGATVPEGMTHQLWYAAIDAEMKRRELEPLEDHPNSVAEAAWIDVYGTAPKQTNTVVASAIVDMVDFTRVSEHRWYLVNNEAAHYDDLGARFLDQFVTKTRLPKIDHLNGNKLDCTRKNLRIRIPMGDYKVRADDLRIENV